MSDDLLVWWEGIAFALGLGFAILLLLAEELWPRTRQRLALGRRWLANSGVLAAVWTVNFWLRPVTLLSAALLADQWGWGLFNWLSAPELVAIVVSWLAVDLSAYAVHRLEHRVPLLWRVHRLHHSDPDVDVTTTYRFHPLEVLLRHGAEVMVVLAIGMPPVAAVGFLLLAAVVSPLSHANVRLPEALDGLIRLLVITPDMHRMHHSTDDADGNSNFSVTLSCWDPLFGTYRHTPTLGHEKIIFGVASRSAAHATSIPKMLADPFLPEQPAGSAIPSVIPAPD